MGERESIAELIRNEYDPCPNLGRASYPAFESEWDDGAGRIADAILADKMLLLRRHAEEIDRLTRENEEMRKALESTEMQAVVQQAIMRHPHWGMASGPTSAYGFAGSALKAIVAALSSLKETPDAKA